MTGTVKNPSPPIDSRAALAALKDPGRRLAFLDVRSEGEFEETCIPGFTNLPILNNEHRHLVGIRYKEQGQKSAIELGWELVGPIRDAMIAGWVREASAPGLDGAIVTCWRGGLRSKLASEWLAEAGVSTRVVAGGYKAMRRVLLDTLETPPRLVLLCGLTGAGKTRFLKGWPGGTAGIHTLDLEGAALHRGSSFGSFAGKPQPRQASFENAVALRMLGPEDGIFLLEDESKLIGRLMVPLALDQKMSQAPRIVLKAPIEERVRWIFEEYVLEPLAAGADPGSVETRLREAIERLRSKLGSQRTLELTGALQLAFRAGGRAPGPHQAWIEPLLTGYYDPMYAYAANRRGGPVVFEGSADECRRYLAEEFRHPEPTP